MVNTNIQFLNKILFIALLSIFGIFIKQYFEQKVSWQHYEIEARNALLQIYDADWKWYELDIDDNSIQDFWVRDVAGLFFYNRPKTGKSIKFIPKEIAVADLSPYPEFYFGNQFNCVPYQGYFFKMAQYDEDGRYQAKKDPATNLEYCDDKFCVIAFPAFNKNLHTFMINSNKRILFKKVEVISKADKWPKEPEKEGWTELELK